MAAATRQQAGSLFERLGVSNAAGAGFLLLVLLAASLLLFSQFQQTQKLQAIVLSSGAPLAQAEVQAVSSDGSVIASGVTDQAGRFEIPGKLAGKGRLLIKASKKGFVAANGDLQAIAVLDSSKRKPASIELFSTQLQAEEYYGSVSFQVLDKLSLKPIPSATLNIAAGGSVFPLSVNGEGRASLQLAKTERFRLKVSAPGYYSDSFSFLALRPEEKIVLSPRSAEVSFINENSQAAPKELRSSNTLLDSSEGHIEFFMPQAAVQIVDSQGNLVQSGSISVVSSSGQEIFSAPIESGSATISSLPVSGGFRLVLLPQPGGSSALDGTIRVFDPATNNLLFTSTLKSGSALLSPAAISAATSPTQSGVLVLSASTLSGVASTATFTLANGQSCSGQSCALALPIISSGGPSQLQVTVSSPGIEDFTVGVPVSPGQVSFASIALPPPAASIALGNVNLVSLLGVFDGEGRQVSSLLPGGQYSLKFSFYSSAQDETVFSVRLGSKPNAADEEYALVDFIAEGFSHSTKSVSYSPKPVCDDLNNAFAQHGLFKWVQLFFENHGAPVQKILWVPFYVKPVASASAGAGVQVFYRLEARSGGSVARVPQDALLANALDSPSKAGCYADEKQASVPVALLSGCADGTRENECSQNKPLACSRGRQATLELKPLQNCCPQALVLSGGSCVSPDAQYFAAQAKCGDGTDEGQCSSSNKPKVCSAAQLVLSSSCCSAGEAFENGFCRPLGAPCRIGAFTFLDGACLPTKPGLCRGGIEVLAPEVCGCPAGASFNSQSNSCQTSEGVSLSRFLSCSDGTSIGACSQAMPLQCISFGGRLLLESNALACGCPADKLSDGVECRQRQAITPPQGGATSTPSPAPNSFFPTRSCSTPNSCLKQGESDEYCDARGIVTSSCFACNRDCGGNENLVCNLATGACESKKCLLPPGRGTPVGQCVSDPTSLSRYKPFKCVLSPDNEPILIGDASGCGCPAGQKPDVSGESCIACEQEDCSDAGFVCRDAQGNSFLPTQCLDEIYGAVYGEYADPIKQCLPDGRIVSAAQACGCPHGYSPSRDGSTCLPDSPPSRISLLPASASCAGCVDNDTVFFDERDLRLKTLSGATTFRMQADTLFPADAFSLFVKQPASQTYRIVLKNMRSDLGALPCYSFNENTGELVFRASHGGDACPVTVVGDKFYLEQANDRRQISSDNLTVVLATQSVPPIEISLKVTVDLVSQGGLLVLPLAHSGPSTPQLFYILNEKNDLVPRTFELEASSTQSVQLPGVGAETLAWRGPGVLSVREGSVSVARLSYSQAPTFFACTGSVGGTQVSSASDWRDCTSGWCSKPAFSQAFSSFKEYVSGVAQASAFRRGSGQPWKRLMGSEEFKQVMVAQVSDGAARTIVSSGITLSGFQQCGNFSMPGVFEIIGATLDGSTFSYRAKVASLKPFDYIDGTCKNPYAFDGAPGNSQQLLCRFLYGKCDTAEGGACIERDAVGNLITNNQNQPENSIAQGIPPWALMGPLLASLLSGLGKKGGQDGQGGGGGGGGSFGSGDDVFDGLAPEERSLLNVMPSHLYSPFKAVNNEQSSKIPKFESFSGPSDADSKEVIKKADELNGKYVEARKKTNSACSPPGDFRKGEREFWIDQKVANKPEIEFVVEPSVVKNNGELVKPLDECENKGHGAEQEKTLQKFAATDCKHVQTNAEETKKKLFEEIGLAKMRCEGECVLGDTACAAKCEKAGKEAKKQVEEKLGTDEQIKATFEKASANPAASGSSSGTSCAEAIRAELSAGDDCESMNKQYAGADKIRGLLVEPLGPLLRRTAWVTNYAYGEDSGAEGNSGDSGKCALVCQQKDKFLHVFAASRKAFAIERYGLNDKCEPEKPTKTSSVPIDNANALFDFLNSFLPWGGSVPGQFTTTGYIGGMKVTATPGSGRLVLTGGAQGRRSEDTYDEAVEDAFKYLNLKREKFDVNINLYNGYSYGNSHGLAMSLNTVAALRNKPFPFDVTEVTGAPRAGQIGGTFEKANVGVNAGKKYVIAPRGQCGNFRNKGLVCYEAGSLAEAVQHMENIERKEGRSTGLEAGRSRNFGSPKKAAIPIKQYDSPFDPTTPTREKGAGILPSVGNPGADGKLYPFEFTSVFDAKINAPASLGAAPYQKVPDKQPNTAGSNEDGPQKLRKMAGPEEKYGLNEPACIDPFLKSFRDAQNPDTTKLSFLQKPSDKVTMDKVLSSLRDSPLKDLVPSQDSPQSNNLQLGARVTNVDTMKQILRRVGDDPASYQGPGNKLENLLNNYRRAIGLKPLQIDPSLRVVAQRKANDIERRGVLQHTPNFIGGEIIFGSLGPNGYYPAIDRWFDSEPHRIIMLGRDWTLVGGALTPGGSSMNFR